MTRHRERPACTEAQLSTAAGLLKKATRVVFFTGAGMSADSGIATFRASSSGFWGGITGPLLLGYFGTPMGWRLTPGYAWRMYLKEFYGPIARAAPHEGHLAIARLEREWFPGRLDVVTMNVDGYHHKAGSSQVWEVHGSVTRNRCPVHGLFDLPPDVDMSSSRCPTCRRYPRPDVVLFTEALPASPFMSAQSCVSCLEAGRDVMVVVGTTGVVYPAAGLPEQALARGVKLIEVNLDPSPLSASVDVFLQGRAVDVLPRLVDMVLTRPEEEGEDQGSM